MKYVFLILVSLFFLLRTYDSAPGEFTTADLGFISIIFTAVLLLQLAVIFVLRRLEQFQLILTAIFAVFNTFSLHAVLIGPFLAQGHLVMAGVALVNVFVVKVLLDIFRENPKFGYGAIGLLVVACGVTYASTLYTVYSASDDKAIETEIASKNLRHVEFTQKPNLYFVAFDSIQSRPLVKKYMELDGAAYHDVFESEFRQFKNAFADAVPTLESLNSLLSLDMEFFNSKPMEKRSTRMFAGLTPSPLMQIFKKNGYVTNTIYNTRYFGKASGPHVDNYWVNSKFSVCEFLDYLPSVIGFFGYCQLSESRKFKRMVAWLGLSSVPNKVTYMIDSMRQGLKSAQPQIWVGYVYSPGHTEKDFRYKNNAALEAYREKYVRNSKKAAEYLERLVKFIKNEDPNGILLVFGDHGPWLTRGLKPTKKHLEFFVLDRFAVLGGIYPKKACEAYVDTEQNTFMTPIKAVLNTIECFSSGEKALVGEFNRQIMQVKPTASKGTSGRVIYYDDFLYE